MRSEIPENGIPSNIWKENDPKKQEKTNSEKSSKTQENIISKTSNVKNETKKIEEPNVQKFKDKVGSKRPHDQVQTDIQGLKLDLNPSHNVDELHAAYDDMLTKFDEYQKAYANWEKKRDEMFWINTPKRIKKE